MGALSIFFTLSIIFGGILSIFAALFITPLFFFVLEAGNLSSAIALSSYLVALPLSSFLALLLLEKFVLERKDRGLLSLLALVLTGYLLLESPTRFLYLEELQTVISHDLFSTASMILVLAQKGVLCAVISALVIALVILTVELPFCWFVSRDKIAISIKGLRVLLLFFVLISAGHLMIGFFSSAFMPGKLLGAILP